MPATKRPQLTAEDHQRVCIALEQIEDAQRLLLKACEQLCPVPRFANQWHATSRVHDQVKAHWYKVEARRQQLRPVVGERRG